MYFPLTWEDEPTKTTPINKARLEYMESGIQDAAAVADAAAPLNSPVFTGHPYTPTLILDNVNPVTPDPRNPFRTTMHIKASDAGTSDHIAHVLQTVIEGSFASDTGADPKQAWGENIFTVTGSAAGDANGLQVMYGSLIEADVAAPAGSTIATVIGLQAEATFFGASAGATVTEMRSLYVANPRRKGGATAGTATSIYGLRVAKVTASDTGATNAYSVYVDGGKTIVNGFAKFIPGVTTDVPLTAQGIASQTGNMFEVRDSTLNLLAHVGADGKLSSATLVTANDGVSGQVQMGLIGGQSAVSFGTGTPDVVLTRSGASVLDIGPAIPTTTTAPSAGGAGALPATPTGYVTLSINGTQRKLAYY